MPTSRAADTRMVLDAVRGIVHALRTSSRRAERHAGISGARLFVLQKLSEAPGMSLNELAARTHTHQSSVSTVVTRLVADGLVRRSRSTADGRSLHLSLTSRGSRMAAGAPDLAQERLVRAIDSLSPARRRLLASTLSELSSALDAERNAPAMFFEQPPRRRPARSDG
ncbi:MAG TPA: MarR family transcriptional regulator [Vicinamibacterales bacterium]|nr:MarR family transcriptional regulator [Vicinamibacterales bacterium]